MLCNTSGMVDDAMFSHDGMHGPELQAMYMFRSVCQVVASGDEVHHLRLHVVVKMKMMYKTLK